MGSSGTELLMVTLTEPGKYQVQVRQQDSGPAKFQIGAAWISFPGFAQPPDPDRRPAEARAIDIGKSYEDSIGTPAGDRVDWYSMTPKTAGTLTVILRPIADSKVDLTLEVYIGGDMTKAAAQSDQDLQGSGANESVTLDVPAGQKVLVRVAAAGERHEREISGLVESDSIDETQTVERIRSTLVRRGAPPRSGRAACSAGCPLYSPAPLNLSPSSAKRTLKLVSDP